MYNTPRPRVFAGFENSLAQLAAELWLAKVRP